MVTSYPLHKIKVVLLENIHPEAISHLEAAGYTVEHHRVTYEGDELIDVCKDAHIVGIRSKTHITAEALRGMSKLWAVGCYCIGTNQVDLEAAAAGAITVFNSPFSNTRSVAEKVIAEIIGLHRRLPELSMQMHQGTWSKSAVGSHEIRGRTLGIVGYGRIGSQVSILAEAMGMRVIYFDIDEVLTLGNAVPTATLEKLLRESDVVTLHVPGTTETAGMFDAGRVAQMKPGAYLINNARGNVVDLEALAAAIREGRVGGAAVDVFPEEPKVSKASFDSPLRGLPNVILSPHVGGSTEEAQEAIAVSCSTRLVKLMNNGATATAVNVPEVQLPRLHPECHRILHYHRNVPGVLGELHSRLARFGVNIVAEYLQSNPLHSYAIIDIEALHDRDHDRDDELRAALRQVQHTIRVRTLW